jgi:hypothetical protein
MEGLEIDLCRAGRFSFAHSAMASEWGQERISTSGVGNGYTWRKKETQPMSLHTQKLIWDIS